MTELQFALLMGNMFIVGYVVHLKRGGVLLLFSVFWLVIAALRLLGES